MPAPSTQQIRFLLTRPDGGEAPFWTWPNHDDSGWRIARSLEELATLVRTGKVTEAWVRIKANLSPESINNTFFHICHSGSIEISVNGLKRAASNRPEPEGKDYLVGPRRPEILGKNVYAIHFAHLTREEPLLEIRMHSSPWRCSDPGLEAPEPLLPNAIRDAQVCCGPDGSFYLTGTTGDGAFMQPGTNAWLRNRGIQLFESRDLKHWESLGWVWTFERDGTWNRDFGTFGGRGPARGIFAPEIHYLKGKFWVVYSVNHTTPKHTFGIGLAVADKPQGPWREVSPEKPLTDGFDATLFEEDDGTVYLLKHGGEIARLSPDLTRLVEPPRRLSVANYPYAGYEGVCLFKHQGHYFLTAAEWNLHPNGTQSYDSMAASSTNLFGPYGPRVCALRFGGHNSYFKNRNGDLFATIWCYPDSSPHWQRVSIVQILPEPDGTLRPSRFR